MTEDFSLSQSLLLLVSQLLLRVLLLCRQEAGVTHGGEYGGPVPEAGMLRWGCSFSLRGHTASCEWHPEAHSWGLGVICTDGTAGGLLHSCEPSVPTLWTAAFWPLVLRSPRFACSAPSGPAGAGVMAREHLLFSHAFLPPSEDVQVWEEPGLWRQRPVTVTWAPGAKPL